MFGQVNKIAPSFATLSHANSQICCVTYWTVTACTILTLAHPKRCAPGRQTSAMKVCVYVCILYIYIYIYMLCAHVCGVCRHKGRARARIPVNRFGFGASFRSASKNTFKSDETAFPGLNNHSILKRVEVFMTFQVW